METLCTEAAIQTFRQSVLQSTCLWTKNTQTAPAHNLHGYAVTTRKGAEQIEQSHPLLVLLNSPMTYSCQTPAQTTHNRARSVNSISGQCIFHWALVAKPRLTPCCSSQTATDKDIKTDTDAELCQQEATNTTHWHVWHVRVGCYFHPELNESGWIRFKRFGSHACVL